MQEDDPTAIDPDEVRDEVKPTLELPPEEGVDYDGDEEELPDDEFLDAATAREDETVDDEEQPPTGSGR
jgi:hypothetical protein